MNYNYSCTFWNTHTFKVEHTHRKTDRQIESANLCVSLVPLWRATHRTYSLSSTFGFGIFSFSLFFTCRSVILCMFVRVLSVFSVCVVNFCFQIEPRHLIGFLIIRSFSSSCVCACLEKTWTYTYTKMLGAQQYTVYTYKIMALYFAPFWEQFRFSLALYIYIYIMIQYIIIILV